MTPDHSATEDRLDQLFKKWRTMRINENPFVKDGINDLAEWDTTPLKLLFMLKETNDRKDPKDSTFIADWDLRELWCNGAKDANGKSLTSTSGPLSRWIDGILHRKYGDWRETGSGLAFCLFRSVHALPGHFTPTTRIRKRTRLPMVSIAEKTMPSTQAMLRARWGSVKTIRCSASDGRSSPRPLISNTWRPGWVMS